MPAHLHLLRQFHLVQRLQAVRGRALPFAELRRYLLEHPSLGDYGGGYELRTFQRDVREVVDLFGISIKSRRGQGYYIAETEQLPPGWPQLPAALAPFVQPDPRQPLGLEHLRPLLRAVQARRVVDFTYQKFWDDAPGQRTVEPLLLKEFRGRWYVLGAMAVGRRRGQLTCFGLDRISGLVVSERAFIPPPGFDAATYYAHAFGIIRPEAAAVPQEIVLRFRPEQGRYALSYPLHASQRLVRQSATEIVLALTVFDTHDLRMELLSYGPEVAVLAPPALRDWLQGQHAEAGALWPVAP